MMVSRDIRPRDQRDSVMLMARVRLQASGEPSEHRIRNLSPQGVCIEYPGCIEKGASLLVDVGQLVAIPAEVAWSRNELVGLRFLRVIDLVAARKRRGVPTPVKAGWFTAINDRYRS